MIPQNDYSPAPGETEEEVQSRRNRFATEEDIARRSAADCSRSSDVRECGEVTISRNGYIEQVERERDVALAREAAIIQFCEVEMGWEFFRAEFQIGDNPSKSLENAMKLRRFLSENAGVLAHADKELTDQ